MRHPEFKEIVEFVKNESYFDVDGFADDEDDDDDEDNISFDTRENGSVYDCECSPIDIKESYRLKKLLEPKYPALTYEVEYCDEWVFLHVKKNADK